MKSALAAVDVGLFVFGMYFPCAIDLAYLESACMWKCVPLGYICCARKMASTIDESSAVLLDATSAPRYCGDVCVGCTLPECDGPSFTMKPQPPSECLVAL